MVACAVTPLTTGAAAAKPLELSQLRVNTKRAPALVRVRVPARTELRLDLNGTRTRDAFVHRSGAGYIAHLSVQEGLRRGLNRLELIAIGSGGKRRVANRRFRVSGELPLASAGQDRQAVVGRSIKLNAGATRAGAGGLDYHWRVVAGPGSSPQAGLRAPDRRAIGKERGRNVTFEPRRPGIYQIRVTVKDGDGGASRDTTFVAARPDDPPIGVSIETMADATGTIKVDGNAVQGTGTQVSSMSYALLDRQTRKPPRCTSSPTSGSLSMGDADVIASLKQLQQIVHDCNDPLYMLVLSSPYGILRNDCGVGAACDELDKLLTAMGGSALSPEQRHWLTSVSPGATGPGQFSAIGYPGSPEGSAYTSIGEHTEPASPAGKLSGYLRFNGSVERYGFLFTDYVNFDTAVETSPGPTVMQIGDQRIELSRRCNIGVFPEPECQGFFVVSVDAFDLGVRFARAFPVNRPGGAGDESVQNDMANTLKSFNSFDLVFIQSYGAPRPSTPAWDAIAQQIQLLGGSRTVFNQLDGSGEYALAGSVCQPASAFGCNPVHGGSGSAAEAGAKCQPDPVHSCDPATGPPAETGQLQGFLARNHFGQFDLGLADDVANVTAEVLPVLYQAPKAFPTIDAGANAAIARRLLGDGVQPADMREQYWRHYDTPEKWKTRRTTLASLTHADVAATCGCTLDAFNAAKAQIDKEIEALDYVESWIAQTQGILDPTTKTYFDLKQIGDDIKAAVAPPDRKEDVAFVEAFLFALDTVGALAPEGGEALGILSGLLALAAGQESGTDGAPLMGEIETRTSEVLKTLGTNYELARGSLVDMGKIITSDYGKLTTVAENVNGGPWAYPSPDVPLRTSLNKGFKAWMYSELMPAAWIVWRVPGVSSASQWSCYFGRVSSQYVYPFRPDSPMAQYNAVTGFNSDLSQVRPLYALGIRDAFPGEKYGSWNARQPPPSVIDPLFKKADLNPGSNNLGLFPQRFYENEFEHQPMPYNYSASGKAC